MTATDTMAYAEHLIERFVTLSTGVRLQYVEQGRADGVPVVFLHGVTDSWRSFEPVLPHLSPAIHAFAISQRGHGDSSRPDAGYGHGQMAADVRAFMDAMELSTAVIVGHSMGAMVAQRFAVDHPARVRGLVLMAAFSTHRQADDLIEFVGTRIALLADPIDPAFVREFQVSTLAHDVSPSFLDTVVGESLKVPARVWRAAFGAHMAARDLTGDLAAMEAPALLVWGDRDDYAGRSDQETLLTAIPRARLVTYQGVGHAVHWEQPGLVARDLTAFVLDAARHGNGLSNERDRLTMALFSDAQKSAVLEHERHDSSEHIPGADRDD
jgi:non-heme chloroperoxidase